MIILEHLRIKEHFDYILCGDKVMQPKPSGEILKKILGKLSVNASAAVYIGDMTIDAQAGGDASLKTVVVLTGSSTKEEVTAHQPFKIIPEISQVIGILAELNSV